MQALRLQTHSPARLMPALLLAVAIALAITPQTSASTERTARAKYQFRKANHCPATGNVVGPCPGWIADHRIPLCSGGADSPDNIQWITREAARIKDRADIARCARARSQTKR
jgi:hypothetical protein